MTKLSEDGIELLTSARERISDVLRDTPKRKDDTRSAMARVLNEVDPGWRAYLPREIEPRKEVLKEIDQALRDLRASQPKLKTHESRTRSGLRLLGYDLPNGHGTHLAQGDWETYRLSCANVPPELPVFISECQTLGLGPDKVTNGTLALVLVKWRNQRPEHSAKTSMRRIVAHFKKYPPTEGYVYTMPGLIASNRKRGNLDAKLMAQFTAWGGYRVHGDSVLPPVGDITAAREVAILQYLVGYTDDPPSIACITALLVPRTAEAALDAMKAASERKDRHDGWGAMTYEGGRILCNIASSHFLASLGLPGLPTEDQEALEELATTYSPKSYQDVSRKLSDKLRVFTQPDRASQLLALPETLSGDLLGRQELTYHEKIRLTVAFALRLAFEVPESTARLAGIPTNAFEIVHEGTDPCVLVVLSGSAPGNEGTADGDLSPEGIALYRAYLRLVRDEHKDAISPYLFLGRGNDHKSPAWFSRQIAILTGDQLGISLSVRELRWVLAFLSLAQDENARDLAASYLGHKRRAYIEPLLKLVDDWRRSGAFK